jgi:hypothetical protein
LERYVQQRFGKRFAAWRVHAPKHFEVGLFESRILIEMTGLQEQAKEISRVVGRTGSFWWPVIGGEKLYACYATSIWVTTTTCSTTCLPLFKVSFSVKAFLVFGHPYPTMALSAADLQVAS